MSYSIIIFKNKIKKKILNNFKDFKRASKYFNKLIDKNSNIIFEKKLENGSECLYEIALVGPYVENSFFFKKDSNGKNIKIFSENKDFSIIQIENYKKEEKIFDIKNNRKISLNEFISICVKSKGLKFLSKLNNKIIYQNDDFITMYSLKSDKDCYRLFEYLESYIFENQIKDCLMVDDFDFTQKKYMYDLLEKNGFSKNHLYRVSTTHLK
jgi:hypothetical protein